MANSKVFDIQYDVLMKYNGSDREVVIPDGVKAIGKKAFYKNNNIESIKIPESVTEIGTKAFEFCEKLVEVHFPKTLEKIGAKAFSDCSSLIAVNIPDSVTYIGHHSFFNCGFKSVVLPDNLKDLGYLAFGGQNPLEYIKAGPDNNYFSTEDGVLYNKDKTTLIMFPQNKQEAVFNTPDSVKKIEAFAFSSLGNGTVVKINEGVEEIGEMAFSAALNAGDVYLPSTITKLGDDVFNIGFGVISKADVYCVKGSPVENLLRDNNKHDAAEMLIKSVKDDDDE